MPQTNHYYISGRVQGVFFRAHTEAKAQSLNLTGWVKNLPDGRVEIMASGDEEALEAFSAWLHIGSPLSKVKEVASETIAWKPFDRFRIVWTRNTLKNITFSDNSRFFAMDYTEGAEQE